MSDQTSSSNDKQELKTQNQARPLRIWIPVLLLVIMIAMRFCLHVFENVPQLIGPAIFGPIVCSALLVLWWLFASRATWKEKMVGFIGLIVVGGITMFAMHPSMRGPAIMFVTAPMGFGLFGLGAVLCSRCAVMKRAITAVLFALVGFGASIFMRTDGLWGNNEFGLYWRWSPTPESRLLAGEGTAPKKSLEDLALDTIDQKLANPDWPGFRGKLRDGVVRGVHIAPAWDDSVSEPVWKVAVGPGWASFAVAGDLLFTQEQRGEVEAVVCYDANSGGEVWKYEIESRFEDPLGGPGPRATPTLASGNLYALGANGHLLCLKPKTGKLVWEKDLQKVAKRKPPTWGFCSSPLIVGESVIVHAGGDDDLGTLGFDTGSGKLKWSVPAGDHTYCSPALLKVAGQEVVAMLTNRELAFIDPVAGKIVATHECESPSYRALQPQSFEKNSVLIVTGMGVGTHRIDIEVKDGKWTTKEAWVSKRLKPDFNDFVVVGKFAYGFDGKIFTCIDLKDGTQRWRAGRYGKGQVMGLASGQLLVITEKGEVILLPASPDMHQELAKLQAIKGKTWNHPVLVGDRLYVRNSQEAACFRLPIEKLGE